MLTKMVLKHLESKDLYVFRNLDHFPTRTLTVFRVFPQRLESSSGSDSESEETPADASTDEEAMHKSRVQEKNDRSDVTSVVPPTAALKESLPELNESDRRMRDVLKFLGMLFAAVKGPVIHF